MSGIKDMVEQFKKLDTTSVSDALDRFGITGGLLGIKPVCTGTTLCGQAFTVRYTPCGAIQAKPSPMLC